MQWGSARARKGAGRTGQQGIIEAYVDARKRLGVLLEIHCETDFVARTPQFADLAHEIAMQIAATNPRYLRVEDVPAQEADQMKAQFREEAIKQGKPEQIVDRIAEGQVKKAYRRIVLLEQPSIRDDSRTVGQLVQELANQVKESIEVRRFSRFDIEGWDGSTDFPPTEGQSGPGGGDSGPQGAPVPSPTSSPTMPQRDAVEPG